MYTFKEFRLDELTLWDANPRLYGYDNSDIVIAMINNQGEKLYKLTKNIAERGLIEPIAVLKDNNINLVKEGNRRIIALMILKNPDIINNYIEKTKDRNLKNRLKNLSNNTSSDISFNKIIARVYDIEYEDELDNYIENRHMGENKGIGVVGWNANQKANWDIIRGNSQPITQFLIYLKENNILTLREIRGVTKTNWERIFTSKRFQDYLNISRMNKEIITPTISENSKLKYKIIADELKNKSVKIVYDDEARKELLEKVDKIYSELINEKQNIQDNFLTGSSSELPSSNDEDKSTSEFKGSTSTKSINQNDDANNLLDINNIINSDNKIESQPLSGAKIDLYKINKRNFILPEYFNYKTKSTKINQMLLELHTIKVETFPIASSILLRCFIEQLSKCYADENKIEYSDSTALYSLINTCATHLKDSKLISKEVHSNIHGVTKNPNKSYISILHGIIHQPEAFPQRDVIIEIFDVLEEYCKQILINLNIMA